MVRRRPPRKGAKKEAARIEIVAALGRTYDEALEANTDKTKIKKLYLVHRNYKRVGMFILSKMVSDKIAIIKNNCK